MDSDSTKERLNSYIENGDETLINILLEVATSYNSNSKSSLDVYNQDIEEGLEQFKRGDFITQNELEAESEKW